MVPRLSLESAPIPQDTHNLVETVGLRMLGDIIFLFFFLLFDSSIVFCPSA